MRLSSVLFCTVLLLLTVWGRTVYAADVDVVLIAGQSNATGQGYMRNLPVSFTPDTRVMIYHSAVLNRGAKPSTGDRWLPLHPASETADRFGPELSLGTRLMQRFPNRRWALIKHATSGSNLYAQWNPAPGSDRGPEFALFMKTVRDGLAKLRAEGHTPHVRAMVWQQGCNDARFNAPVSAAENYAANLGRLIETVRNETDSPEMAFIFGQVMPMPAKGHPRRDTVRARQKLVDSGSGSPFAVRGARWIPTDDLELRRQDYHTPYPHDELHLGTYGQLDLGERFADAVPAL